MNDAPRTISYNEDRGLFAREAWGDDTRMPKAQNYHSPKGETLTPRRKYDDFDFNNFVK
jgi:hypothetical protein